MTANPPTTNGNAFNAVIEGAAAYLEGIDSLGYYRERMPSDTDTGLYDIVGRFQNADAAQRRSFVSNLTTTQRSPLALFAHRAATVAVRLKSKAWLEKAMLASVIANYEMPESRNIDVQLAVLHHCAVKLGEDPAALFDWAATFAVDPLAAHLEAFGRREDVSLKKFGWVEQRTPDGVQFSAKWQ